ncbi:Protein F58B4.6 [Aphelenchoides avenae]|nr:Protein F58B4.6 [Aphelenchus avenae]
MKAQFALVFLCLSVGAVNVLRCHQGQCKSSTSMENLTPQDCIAGSTSCILTYNAQEDLVTRRCQIANCSDIDEAERTSSGCTKDGNVFKKLGLRGDPGEYCCCYGDGCNKYMGSIREPDAIPRKKTLVASTAQRIEDFYDDDATLQEKAFIRKVQFAHASNIDIV